MNLKTKLSLIIPLAAIALLWLIPACKREAPAGSANSDVAYYTCTMHPSVRSQDPKAKCPICGMDLVPVKKKAAAADDADYYTCTMHPSVKKKNSKDKCPICSMDLVPVKKTGPPAHDHGQTSSTPQKTDGQEIQTIKKEEEQPSEFTVPVERQQQIGVTYAAAENKPLHTSIRAVGIVASDRARHWDIVTRVDGYVEKLFLGSQGELVEKGQQLITLYSPDLLTTQREFADLLRARDEAKKSSSAAGSESIDRLIEAAKVRLR